MITRKKEEILLNYKRNELLKMSKLAVSTISKMRLKNLSIAPSYFFGLDCFRFEITVFDKSSQNRSFGIYDFYDLEKCKKYLSEVMVLIRTDNFSKVEKYDENGKF